MGEIVGKSPVLFLLAVVVIVVIAALVSLRGGRREPQVPPRGSAPPPGPGDRGPLRGPSHLSRPIPFDEWLGEVIGFYRDLGFMPEHEGKPDAEVLADVKALLDRNWGDQLQTADAHSLELFLTEAMPSRIWWRDTEADVAMGNRVYEEVLAEWSRISVGAFKPHDIVETWEGEEGPLTVAFTLDGQPIELHPKVSDDWLDLAIIDSINPLIAASGRRFVVFIPDQTAVIMCVTPEERARLERKRGWKFL